MTDPAPPNPPWTFITYQSVKGVVILTAEQAKRIEQLLAASVPRQSIAIQTANAQLIAAAPELLAALKRLVGLLNDDLDPDQCAAWDDAVAAIAKAEGR